MAEEFLWKAEMQKSPKMKDLEIMMNCRRDHA